MNFLRSHIHDLTLEYFQCFLNERIVLELLHVHWPFRWLSWRGLAGGIIRRYFFRRGDDPISRTIGNDITNLAHFLPQFLKRLD